MNANWRRLCFVQGVIIAILSIALLHLNLKEGETKPKAEIRHNPPQTDDKNIGNALAKKCNCDVGMERLARNLMPASEDKSSKSAKKSKKDKPDSVVELYWTLEGLEAIPTESWKVFDDNADPYYAVNFPIPGDALEPDHIGKVASILGLPENPEEARSKLLHDGFVSTEATPLTFMRITQNVTEANENDSAEWFEQPTRITRSPVVNRAYVFAQGSGRATPIANKLQGPLGVVGGARTREWSYFYPDMCDATPILKRLFLEQLGSHQAAAFYSDKRIGFWHSLFPDVQRREFDAVDIAVTRFYTELGIQRALTKESVDASSRNGGWAFPEAERYIESVMRGIGLDISQAYIDEQGLDTPVGLGNVVAQRVHEWTRDNDGLNEAMEYVDRETLQQIDDIHAEKTNPFKWVGSLAGSGRFRGLRNGIVTQQTFVMPNLGASSFLYDNDEDFLNLGLQAAVPSLNVSQAAYRERTAEYLLINKDVTQAQRVKAHLINDKLQAAQVILNGLNNLIGFLLGSGGGADVETIISLLALINGVAEFAPTHAAWRHKRTYMGARPEQSLRWLKENDEDFAQNNKDLIDSFEKGPFKGPYIPAGDHPSYPSGSCAIYSTMIYVAGLTFASMSDDLDLSDVLNLQLPDNAPMLSYTLPKESSHWQSGFPTEDVTVTWSSFQEFLDELPIARVWAGVHFLEDGTAGVSLGYPTALAVLRQWGRLDTGVEAGMWTNDSKSNINLVNTWDENGIYETTLGT